MIIFELTDGIRTSDNYFVTLKGFVETEEQLEENDLKLAINKSSQDYINAIPLLDALDLVDPEKAKELIPGLGEYSDKISKLEVSTVDAVEGTDFSDVDVDIDPSLESQKQSKGIFGRIKQMFKR